MVKQSSNRKKYTKSYRGMFRVGRFSLIIVTVALFVVVGAMFLINSNRIAIKGYEIAKLQKKVLELEERNSELNLERSKLQSVSVINEGIKQDKMVPVKQINYVYPNKDVAINRK